MFRKINQFRNGGTIEFDPDSDGSPGLLITRPDGQQIVPNNLQCLSRLKKLGKIHGANCIYDDYVVIYNRSGIDIDPDVFQIISLLGNHYGADALELEVWFNMLYTSMVAEEKKNGGAGKRMKRLWMHHVLIDDLEPAVAINFSKGILWHNLDRLMKAKGF